MLYAATVLVKYKESYGLLVKCPNVKIYQHNFYFLISVCVCVFVLVFLFFLWFMVPRGLIQ